MAMYMEIDKKHKGLEQGPHKTKPADHTLEDVAEEMLNGIFCHYEPPDPTRAKKKKKRGILRAPRMFRRKKEDKRKSVRWSDDPEAVKEAEAQKQPPPVEIHINMANACVDAGIEGGCLSPTEKDYEDSPMYFEDLARSSSMDGRGIDLTEVGAARRYKQKKTKEQVDVLVFDNEGNPVNPKGDKTNIPEPPAPPPPSRKELYLGQLCGVKINCLEDEDQMAELAKSSTEGPPSQSQRRNYDYDDDEENSLVDETKSGRRDRRSRGPEDRDRHDRIPAVSSVDSSGSSEWESESSTPSANLLGRVWNRRARVPSVQTIHEEADDRRSPRRRSASPSRGARQRGRSASPRRDPIDLDPIEMGRSDEPQRFQSRSPRISNDDWDDTLPIIAGRKTASSPKQGRGRWFGRSDKKKEAGRDPSPGPFRRFRGRSAERQEERRRSFDPSALNAAPSRSKSPRRSKSPNRRQSFDPRSLNRNSEPLRSHSPVNPNRLPMGLTNPSPQIVLPPSSLQTYPQMQMRPANPLNQRPQQLGAAQTQRHQVLPATSAPQAYPQMHPAHPLNRRPKQADRDDVMERQSFITAHRQVFDDTGSTIPPPPPPAGGRIGRQANRQGYSGGAVGVPGKDDQFDRQSFITDHRRGFESPKRSWLKRSPGRGRSPSPAPSDRQNRSRPIHQDNIPVSSPDPRRMSDPVRVVDPAPEQPAVESTASFFDPMNCVPSVSATGAPAVNPQYQQQPMQFSHQQQYQQQPHSMHSNVVVLPLQQQVAMQNQVNLQQYQQSAVLPSRPMAEPKKQEDTWEERTRQAWERLRALSFDPPKEDAKTPEAAAASRTLQSPSQNRDQPVQYTQSPQGPVGILRNGSLERKVSFGPSQEQIFHDDQDENRSVKSTGSNPEVTKKKKKVLRGTKLISNLLGRGKNSRRGMGGGKQDLSLSNSRSVDMTVAMTGTQSVSHDGDDQCYYGQSYSSAQRHLQGSSQVCCVPSSPGLDNNQRFQANAGYYPGNQAVLTDRNMSNRAGYA